MPDRLLVCTDLDRTLIANGTQPESEGARSRFAALVSRPEVTLVFVSGRHRQLVQQAISSYRLPQPDFVVADVGTTIYRVGQQNRWQSLEEWEADIGVDWGEKSHNDLLEILNGLPDLRLQENARQKRFKLSYYLPMEGFHERIATRVEQRLAEAGVRARLIWSEDECAGVGLLDILPESASKFHAMEKLMQVMGFDLSQTVFSGDSGNDLEVLASPIPSVLVANASPELKVRARQLADAGGNGHALYIATGGLFGMNGNYSAGILEGIAHYQPLTIEWMKGVVV